MWAIDIFPFFQWVEATSLSNVIRESTWAFAVIESVHLLALAVIGGSVLVVDLRLLGMGLTRHSAHEIWRDAYRWFVGSLIVMLATGVLLFFSEPTKCYYSTPFWVKMSSLALALLFTFTIRRQVLKNDQVSPATGMIVALLSLTFWFGVGAGGRWIGFSG